MSTDISLRELVDLSIGTPDVGSVNFTALHTLLHAILGHLKIERVTTSWKELDNDHDSPAQIKALLLDSSSPSRALEEKVRRMEEQLWALEALPSASELMRSDTALGDLWTLMQLRGKAQANEDGVSKCMALIQDLLKEIQALKESRDDLKQEVNALNGQLSQLSMNELTDRIVAMEQYCHQVEDLDKTTKELKDKMAQYPVPEELTQCVTWEVMQAALISERQKIQEGLQGTISTARDAEPVHPLNLGSPFKDDRASTGELSFRPSPPHPSLSDGTLCSVMGRRLSRVSSGAERYPETLEALKEVGRLRDRHESLETRVEKLEAEKADKSQLQHLRDLLTAMEERRMPDHVTEQLNHLRTLVDSLLADREKVSEVESVLMDMGTEPLFEESDSAGHSSGSASDQSSDVSHIKQMSLQTAHIRTAVLKLDEKVQILMREKWQRDTAVCDRADERRSGDTHIQEELKSLRALVEDLMSSSSSPLSQSHQQEAVSNSKVQTPGQGQRSSQGQRSGQDQGGQQDQEVSQVTKDKSTNLTNQQQRGMRKDAGLVSDVQETVLQLQAECEKLQRRANRLMEEHGNKQIHIDHLYKITEELSEKKADKQWVEMEFEIKADKRAVESKVSRLQFDSMTEQLNNMMQELLSKISTQEQDWNKAIQKISTDMECKLNRIEVDPLKKQLDDRWRTIQKQLQTPPTPEQDDAAGLRKQLVARFRCISCDRPVDMMTPGQHLVSLPSTPGLPSHKSSRPYTVYELEQVRQHCRRQIDQEQSQFPTSRTHKLPYIQGMAEVSRSRKRPNLGPGNRSRRTLSKHERIPEMADYSYLARSCGGSHTLTYPSRRYTRLQHITHLIQTQEEESRPVSTAPPAQAPEVGVLGLDGQVYKGRMNGRAVRLSETRLPIISPREGNWRSKDKMGHYQSQRSCGADVGRGSPARPQSAKTSRSRSASSGSVRDRPMSSMDCLSQDVPLQSSLHDTEQRDGPELHKDLVQSEEEPVTSL